jgi:2-polyprenyl-3-methyl-5-hydroxy-6-metoxy-1,4-benzoquinol methylase
LPFLRRRHRVAEIMDQPDLDAGRHRRALCGLERINWIGRSATLLWPDLVNFGRQVGARPLRILDIATGAGDIPVRLWRRARRAGLDWQIEGCDRSDVALEHARARARAAGADVRFFQQDILANPPVTDHHAVVCSLFLHHLDEAAARALLRWMAGLDGRSASPRLVLVSDLARGLWGYTLAQVATRLLTTSAVVHTDGPRSVAAAFTPAEARQLAEEAGLHGAEVVRRWPARFLLRWRRPA